MADPLQGFRDMTAEQAEAGLRANLGEDGFLVDLWQMSREMEAFAQTPVGLLLIKTFRDRFVESVRIVLTAPDVNGDQVKGALQRARLHWGLLHEIEKTLRDGKVALDQIIGNESGQQPKVTP